MKRCTIDGCDKKHLALGLCCMHYAKQRRYGSTLPWAQRTDPVQHFWSKVSKGDGCWLWTGDVESNYGYGRFRDPSVQRTFQAHRWAYETFVGPIPDGEHVDHACHTVECEEDGRCSHRRCVRPDHLEAKPLGENLARGKGFRRLNDMACRNGHEYTDANTYLHNGVPQCRQCRRAAHERHEAKRREARASA